MILKITDYTRIENLISNIDTIDTRRNQYLTLFNFIINSKVIQCELI